MNRIVETAFAMLLATACASASASVYVYYYKSDGTEYSHSSAISPGADVAVSISSSQIDYVLVYATNLSENVGRVTITGTTGVTQAVWVFVANAPAKDTLFYSNTSTAAGHNFFGLDDQRTQGPTLVKVWVQGDLLDDIDANELVTLQVQASVLAGVKSHGANWDTDHFKVRCGRVSRNKYNTSTPHAGFEQLHHDITRIETNNPTNPELDCPISVPDGSLKLLQVGGYLGQNPVLSNRALINGRFGTA